MTTKITGIVRDLEGQPLVNSIMRFERRSGVRAQADATVVPRVVNAKTDAGGNISVELYPGEYHAQAERGYGALAFRVGVPEDVAEVDLKDLIDQVPAITPMWASETRQARDEAVEAAESTAGSAEAAEDSASSASDSADAASNSAGTAQVAEGGAVDARDKAQEWAENPEDDEVEAGAFSAKHHAAKAAQSAALSNRVIYVDTIADLQALNTEPLQDGQQVSVAEYFEGSGRGGRTMIWDSASTEDDNGGTVIAPDSGSGRWLWDGRGVLTPGMFGDDAAALQTALTTDAGKNALSLSDGDLAAPTFTVPANARVTGRGAENTTLRRPADGATDIQAFLAAGAGVILERLKIDLEQDPDAIVTLATPADDFALTDAVITGPATWDAGTRTGNGAVYIPSGEIAGLTVQGVAVQNMPWLILQSNTNTANISRIKYICNIFEDYAGINALFNAPADGAENSDILVFGNSIGGAAAGADFGSANHWGSFAGHVIGARVVANYKSGGGTFFRSEEAAQLVSFMANTAYTGNGNGIEVIGNDAGGTKYTPRWFSLAGNAFQGDGTTPNRIGISANVTNDNMPGMVETAIGNNVTADYAKGLRLARRADLVSVPNHVSASCELAFQTSAPSLAHRGIMSVDCDVALRANSGGIVDSIHLRSRKSLAEPASAVVTLQSGQSPAGVRRLDFDSRSYDMDHVTADPVLPASSDTVRGLWKLPSVFMRGRIHVYAFLDATNWRLTIIDLVWDGSTLTLTDVDRQGIGFISFRDASATEPPLFDDSGTLAARIRNTGDSDLNGYEIQCWFEGVYLEGAS